MFKYVKWCNSVEEIANGSCRQCTVRTRKYSENKVFRTAAFERVKSILFKTMPFLTVLPRTHCYMQNLNISAVIFRYAQFLPPINGVGILEAI